MTAVYQRQVDARLDHHRRLLQARTVSDALTEVIASLAEAVQHGDGRPEVWRLAWPPGRSLRGRLRPRSRPAEPGTPSWSCCAAAVASDLALEAAPPEFILRG